MNYCPVQLMPEKQTSGQQSMLEYNHAEQPVLEKRAPWCQTADPRKSKKTKGQKPN